MAEMVLQDEFAPMLASRGFERSKKVFRRVSSAGMGMSVWLNPENRLKRVRTINVDCWLGREDDDEGWLYSFDQARAVNEIERAGAWASFDYTPEVPGWPAVMVEDFERVTLPFIDACTDPAALCQLLLEGRVPPANRKQAPIGWIKDVWHIAEKAGLPEYRDEALSRLATLPMSSIEHESALWWADLVGIKDVVLSPPVVERRRFLWWRRGRA